MSSSNKDLKQSRKYLLTINNPEKHGFTHDKIKENLKSIDGKGFYWCMADEIGENGTYHTHLFIYRKTPMRFDMVKRLFPPAHIKKCNGTAQQNRDYCRKEGKYKDSEKAATNLIDTFEEYGECPEERQGARRDLENLYDAILEGKSNYQIIDEDPGMIRYMDKMDKVRELLRFEEFRNKRRVDLHVEYWFGEAGSGKTSGVLDMYGDENVYMITDYLHPWDSYRGQDVVLFDDIDFSRISVNDLLHWLNIYPLELPSRYANKCACYTKVYITNNKSLDSCFWYIQRNEPDVWKALTRRIHVFKEFTASGTKTYTSYDNYQHRMVDDDGFMRADTEEVKQIMEMFGNGN